MAAIAMRLKVIATTNPVIITGAVFFILNRSISCRKNFKICFITL